ncbi:MAG: cytochrome b N-terminal domain-containing protein, partial [Methanomassiliicoccales archaeon]
MELTKPDAPTEGSFNITLRPVTRRELRLDYWTGAFLAAALIFQIITGILLAYYYQPGEPYTSTLALMGTVPFGELLLTSHLYMAYAMVGMVYFHMFRQYFAGAYRGRWRWLQWIIGVFIFAFVNAIAIIGYLLSQTYIGMAALHVSELLVERSIIGRLFPGLANFIVSLMVGNATTLQTWEHLLILHAAILSVIVLVLVAIHFFLYEKSGPYEISRHTNKNEKSVPWFPV